MSDEAPVQVGDIIADKYQVTRVLGAGGMGVVVAAMHLELGQPVALKFLLESLVDRTELVERFIREARNCVSINSEHVVRVADVGRLPTGAPFMVMEFLEGHDLETEVQRQGPLPPARAVDYAIQTCVGLAEAHARHLIHRDLKPANLFLTTRSDGYKLLKILDFGISKSLVGTAAQALTQTNQSMGTPYYMSPEQIRAAANIDGRTDIWSLGAILYEVLSGVPPFAANTASAVCAAVLEASPTPLTGPRPDVPEGLWQVVAWCLSKRAEDRPQNVAELASALSPFAVNERDTHLRVARILGLEARPATVYLPASQQQPAPRLIPQTGNLGFDTQGNTIGVPAYGAFAGTQSSDLLGTGAPLSRTGTVPPFATNSTKKWAAIGAGAVVFVGALAFGLSSGAGDPDAAPLDTATAPAGLPVSAPTPSPTPVVPQPVPQAAEPTPAPSAAPSATGEPEDADEEAVASEEEEPAPSKPAKARPIRRAPAAPRVRPTPAPAPKAAAEPPSVRPKPAAAPDPLDGR